MSEVLKELATVLEQRKLASSENSYVASLYKQGLRKILQKVEEETLELINATREQHKDRKQRIVHEVADLWFHTMILLSNESISSLEILKELEGRLGISGIVEKTSRKENI